ncbi:MAG: SDR family oxidoreductase [Nevskiales bacterium]
MSRPSVFITGAAAGIGRATVERFAREGWFVGLFDVDLAGVQALAAQLPAGQSFAARLDVTDPAAWNGALEQFWQAAGQRLDLLFNNAGILAAGDFGGIPLATQHKIVDVNIKGVMNGCHAALPYLKRTLGARVISMASASAMYGQPTLATYSASKFAVRALTEALDIEWEQHGIRVMDIWPLFVQTAMIRDVGDSPSLKSMGVNLTPQDVADVVWKAAQHRGLFRRVHWPVGLQTWFLYKTMGLVPDWLARWINKRIAAQ